MPPEIQSYIDDQIAAHMHNGGQAQRINLFDLFGMFQTITDATTLTNTKAASPSSVYQQIFIDTSTATKKLYIYDTAGQAWLSVTIA